MKLVIGNKTLEIKNGGESTWQVEVTIVDNLGDDKVRSSTIRLGRTDALAASLALKEEAPK